MFQTCSSLEEERTLVSSSREGTVGGGFVEFIEDGKEKSTTLQGSVEANFTSLLLHNSFLV